MNETLPDLNRLRLPIEQVFTRSESHVAGIKPSFHAPKVRGEFLKGPIPLSWLGTAAKLPGKAPLAVALAIMFEVGRRRSSTITLTTAILERFGVNRKSKYRALQRLEKAGLISVARRPHKNPLVAVLDFQDRTNVESVVACSPKSDPCGMRVLTAHEGQGDSRCRKKQHSPEQIIRKLRDADAMLAAGKTIGQACQSLEISEADVPPLASPVRRDEGRGGQAAEAPGGGEQAAEASCWPKRNWIKPSSKRRYRETSEPCSPSSDGRNTFNGSWACPNVGRAGR